MLTIRESRVATGSRRVNSEELIVGREVVQHPVTVVEATIVVAQQVVSFSQVLSRHTQLLDQ